MSVDARHKFIFTKVAETFGVEPTFVQEIVQRTGKLPLVTEFFKENSSRRLLFYYQQPQSENEFGDIVPVSDSKARLLITDGDSEPLRGKCTYFVRMTPKSVTPARVEEEIICGQLDSNVIGELGETLREVRQSFSHRRFSTADRNLQ